MTPEAVVLILADMSFNVLSCLIALIIWNYVKGQ